MIPLEVLKSLAVSLGMLSVALAQTQEYIVLPPSPIDAPSSTVQTIVRVSENKSPVERIVEARNEGNAPIRGLIVKYARQYGVSEFLALSLADIESDYVPNAQNKKSSAGGIYQFINSTHRTFCEGDKYDAELNIKCAMKLISEGGIGHWCNPETKRELIKLGIKDCK